MGTEVDMGDIEGTGSLPRGWFAPLLSLAPNPTGGFSVISPQTAGVWKSRTTFRAAGVGARSSWEEGGACSGVGGTLGVNFRSGCHTPQAHRAHSFITHDMR